MTRLLIVGATGLVGGILLEQALADPRVGEVIAVTRRPIAALDKLRSVVVDFAALPVDADWWAVDGVVAAMGTTRAATPSPVEYRAIDHDYPLAVARLARENGATRLALISSLGADARSRFAYTRLKGELERDLAAIGYPSLTIARPSVLGGDRREQRTAERVAQRVFDVMGAILPSQWRLSPADAVAAALLEGAIAGAPGVHVLHNAEMGSP